MPSWIVVVRVVIIHAKYEYAARTGLFGLLGDEPVQLVNVSDRARVNAFINFSKESQRKGRVFCAQHLRKGPTVPESQEEKHYLSVRYLGEPKPAIQRAIMFRLCIDMCNHRRSAEVEFRPPPETIHHYRRKWKMNICVGRTDVVSANGVGLTDMPEVTDYYSFLNDDFSLDHGPDIDPQGC